MIAGDTHPFSTAALHAPVSAILETDVGCVTEELTEEELLTFFVVRGVHATAVVAADGTLSGFVSLVDVQRNRDGTREDEPRVVLRGGGGYELGSGFHMQPTRTVADIMTRPAICIAASAQLTQAAALMAFEGVSRLPVVDAAGRVVGILSALDLLRWMDDRTATNPGVHAALAAASGPRVGVTDWSGAHEACCDGEVAILGMVKWKVLPLPSWLCAQMRPPCVSTMHFEMCRPSPNPRRSRLSWRKRSNTASSCSGGMPAPVSDTEKCASSPLASTVTTIVPWFGVYRTALLTRLASTCKMRP